SGVYVFLFAIIVSSCFFLLLYHCHDVLAILCSVSRVHYNIRLVDVQNYYYRLAYARLLSEKKYVDFKESAPELFSALRDNSDITSAKIMIAKLEKVLTDA
ncbi:hypothetical protein, partial [Ruminococcus sp.]|uniref:hypothetical protein n=1 Tax=Ruminococcus sp. TaxID=41978 RepID=UPI003AB87589